MTLSEGQTIVRGGLLRQPAPGDRVAAGLAELPVVGRLFKNVGLGRNTTERLIMVTPRIVIQEEAEGRQTGPRVQAPSPTPRGALGRSVAPDAGRSLQLHRHLVDPAGELERRRIGPGDRRGLIRADVGPFVR